MGASIRADIAYDNTIYLVFLPQKIYRNKKTQQQQHNNNNK